MNPLSTFRFVLLLTLAWATAAAPAGEPAPLRVLFVGNSYTYGNDLPKLVAALAKAGGERPLQHDRQTPGGWSFKKHWDDGKAVAKMENGKWDIVVLQDQSFGALKSRDEMFEFGKKLAAAAKKQGARPLFYMTWARQNTPETQDKISEAYQQLARELKADVAPVGVVWQRALQADDKLVLHVADKSHPNLAGSYLAACVFYAAIYNKSPEGLPGKLGGLSDEAARKLQTIAWRAVQEQQASKRKE